MMLAGFTPGQVRRGALRGGPFHVRYSFTVPGQVLQPAIFEAVLAAARYAFGTDIVLAADGQVAAAAGSLAVQVERQADDCRIHLRATADRADVATLRDIGDRILLAVGGQPLPELQVPQWTAIAAWLNDLAGVPEGAVGREFWRAQSLAEPYVGQWSDFPKPAGASMAMVTVPIGGLAADLRTVAPTAAQVQAWLYTCWRNQLSLLMARPELIVAAAFDLRAGDPLLTGVAGPLTEYCPLRSAVTGLPHFRQVEATEDLFRSAAECAEWYPVADNAEPFAFGFDFSAIPVKSNAGVCTDPFLLRLSVHDQHEEIEAAIWYDQNTISVAEAEDLAQGLASLIASTISEPQVRIDELSPLGPARLRDITVNWAVGEARAIPVATLTELFEAQVAHTPDATALIYGTSRLTYAQLAAEVDRLTHWLRLHGVKRGDRVGICAQRAPRTIAAQLAVVKTGAAYVGLDPHYPVDRLNFMVADSGAVLALVDNVTAATGAGWPCLTINIEQLDLPDAESVAPTPAGPDDLVYVAYSSGSTGQPKGAGVCHRGVVNLLSWLRGELDLTTADRFMHHSSISFDVAARELFVALVSGAASVLASASASREPELLVDEMRQHGVSAIYLVSSLVGPIVAQPGFTSLNQLRYLLCGAESLAAQALVSFHERSAAQLIQVYGPCESTMNATWWRAQRGFGGTQPPIGNPVPNVVIRLLDSQLRPAPPGVAADLYIGGVGVGHGYLGQPGLTAQRFVPDPLCGGRLYRTGDIARWGRNGTLDFLGRNDHQVKIRGFRVELGEVETALGQHPAVAEVAVAARQDTNGLQRLIAYLIGPQKDRPENATLREWATARLPVNMVPSVFEWLEEMPRTANGKVARSALPEPQARPSGGVGGQTPAEKVLGQIWAEVLGLPAVSANDNFFELGGDSILSILVVARAAEQGIRITPLQFFEHQTISELAAAALGARARQLGPAAGAGELTPIQCGFFEQDLAEPGHYHQGWLFALEQPLDPDALNAAVQEVVAHHQALKLTFTADPAAPYGWRPVLGQARVSLRLVPEKPAGQSWEALLAEVQAGFDLETGPLIRFVLIGTDRFAVVAHHLIVDTVSWRILLADLRSAYAAAAAGQTAMLSAATAEFGQWSHGLRHAASGADLAASVQYWLDLPADIAPLPSDFAEAGPVLQADVRCHQVALDTETTAVLLRDLPKRYRASMQDALGAALAQTIARWTGDDRVLIAVEGHGREEEIAGGLDLSRTVGWFTSMAPCLLNISADAPADAAIGLAKEQFRAMPQHGIAYGLSRYLGHSDAAATLSRITAQVRLNYFGQYRDRDVHAGIAWTLAPEPLTQLSSPHNIRSFPLDVLAVVVDGALQLEFWYGARKHAESTIAKLAAGTAEVLARIAAACQESNDTQFSPSDFPLLRTDQAGLDKMLARAAAKRAAAKPKGAVK